MIWNMAQVEKGRLEITRATATCSLYFFGCRTSFTLSFPFSSFPVLVLSALPAVFFFLVLSIDGAHTGLT